MITEDFVIGPKLGELVERVVASYFSDARTHHIDKVYLPNREESGLLQIERILPGIEGVGFCYLDDRDVVRHRLVRAIIRAYAEDAPG